MSDRKFFHGAARGLSSVPLFLMLCLGATLPAWSQAPAPARGNGMISGRVTTLEGEPVTDAVVQLVELRRQATVGADGSFRFDAVPAGAYLLEAVSPRLGQSVERTTVRAGGTAEVAMTLDLTVHQDEILVTASPDARSRNEIAQPTSVLSGEELQRQLQPTLGETLSREPGITSTFFGPGSSRPVIRGLGGDRIRVLESGIGSGDASSTSPDHAVSVDPASAEQIEVLRGPATLLYGSSAVGGVVNVIDNRVPERLPDEPVTGSVEVRGGSVADERHGSATLEGALGGRIAWHLDFQTRETDDYEIPGFAESETLRRAEDEEGEEHEQAFGVLENSSLETEGGSLGVSWVGGQGFFGVAASGFESLYGIPGGAHEHHGEGEEEEEEHGGVRIDMEQRRYDVRGGITRGFGIFRGANLRFGATDYEHVELEGEEIGTTFLNESWEGRLELLQNTLGPLSGSIGLQVQSRDFEAIGDEAFVPPTRTDTWAVFAFEELTRGAWRFQLGGRYENQDVEAATGAVRSRSFAGVSGSFGLVWQPVSEAYSLGLSVARSTKLPNAEELFSNGPHLATSAFEVGDPDLQEETNLGVDLTLRKVTGRLTGEVTFFTNRFDDYIFEQATGAEEGGLQVLRFVQRDAEFRGAELAGVYQLFHDEPFHVDVEFGADFVRAELEDGTPLPRIPARRYRLGIHYRGGKLDGLVEGVRVDDQDRVAPLELPTEGHTLLNASLGYRFFTSAAVFEVLLRGTNLTDEEARNHVSFLKDRVPMPGRDVSLALRVTF